MNMDIRRIIDQVSRDKGIDRSILISTLEEAIKSAAKKRFGLADNFEVSYNEESGEMEVFRFKEVVENVIEPQLEISLEEARILDPDSQIGDELGVKMDTGEFGRIAAQSAKQVIIQRMKDAERDIVYEDFRDREGEIINGIVQRFDKGAIIVNLGRTEALLPATEQIPKENYRRGDRIRALIIDVKQISRGPQVILSRTHPDFLVALFETEVPEIAERIVRIISVAREPGSRAKIAVVSEDPDIDPVGACVGMRGSRVQSVVQELRGEKIDIIPYNPDTARFIVSALAPAVVSRVIMDESNKTMEVVVPDEQLSLAIGRKGQNVRLASKLSGWRIDVKSEKKYERALQPGYQSLLKMQGVNESIADQLYDAGFKSVSDIMAGGPDALAQIETLEEGKADEIFDAAALYTAQVNAQAQGEASPFMDDAAEQALFTTPGASHGVQEVDESEPQPEVVYEAPNLREPRIDQSAEELAETEDSEEADEELAEAEAEAAEEAEEEYAESEAESMEDAALEGQGPREEE